MTVTYSHADRRSLRERIRTFFHAEEVPYGVALVRMTLPFGLLWAMLPRWSHSRELFSTDGASTPLWIGYGLRDMLPEIPGTVAVIFATLLIAALITMSIGWCTRISVLACFVLYTYLTLLDAISTMTKYSVIASHVLLLLSMSECGAVWSVDSWLRKRKARREGQPPSLLAQSPKSAAWPRRLMQLLIGYVYFGAAMTKFHTPAYFSSDQLGTWLRTNINFENPFGEYLSLFPASLILVAYVTVIWEILFLFLCWRGWGRIFMLTIGFGFHVMTALTLGLYVFPMICIAIYFSFLDERDVRSLAVSWRRLSRRVFGRKTRRKATVAVAPRFAWLENSPVPSQAVFGCGMVLIALIGVEAEYLMDPFGTRRPDGPHTLKVVDADYVENVLLAGSEPIRPKDKVDDLQAGTFLIGPVLANARQDFWHGENMQVQCTLNSPHEDMSLDCQLTDADDHIIVTQPKPGLRESSRVDFFYHISNAYEPGTYYLVLKCAGKEVMRRTITIHPRRNRADAN